LDAKLTEPRQRYKELMNDLAHVEDVLLKGAEKARHVAADNLSKIRIASGIRPLTYVASNTKEQAEKKEKTAEELERIEAGRQRAILLQLKPLLDQVAQADDKQAAAKTLVAQKQAEVEHLKKKARQKAQNELELLQHELAEWLN